MTRHSRPTAVIIAICLLATGCVQHQWAPGPGTDPAAFGRANGECKLAAMGVGNSNFAAASGRYALAFVGASMLASSIGNAVRQHQAYEACLEASGFVPVAAASQVPQ